MLNKGLLSMSWGFWFNLTICICSLFRAWIDYCETYKVFKESSGKDKQKNGAKLFLLWGIPLLAIIALPFTVWESSQLKKQISTLEVAQESRIITQDQVNKFISLTKDAPKGPVTVHVYYNESEPSNYARQIRNVLNVAGYTLGSNSGFRTSLTPPKKPEFGLFLGVKDINKAPEFAGPVQKALESVGIEAKGYDVNFIPEGELWVFIGMKPK